MENQYKIADSSIHGKGVISKTFIPKNTVIGIAIIVDVEPYLNKSSRYGCFEAEENLIYFEITGNLGVWVNHQEQKDCNSKLVRNGHVYHLISTKEILPEKEITSNYQDTPFFIKKNP